MCTDSNEVFLKTDLIELGIHSVASFGTTTTLPYSYGYAYSNYCGDCRLGFICDFGGDGLTVGNPPFSGDYFVPGTPVEGWTLQYTNQAMPQKFTNAGLMGSYGISADSVEITSDDTNYQQSVWKGHTAEVSVVATTSIPYNKKLFFVDTCITNNVDTEITDLYYMRNIDPDQQEPWNGVFTTYNYVKYQPSSFGYSNYVNPSNPDMAVVVARGNSGGYEDLVFALGAVDPRAFVSHGGFYNTNPEMYYNYDTTWLGYGGVSCDISDTSCMSYADDGVNLVFKHDSLAPGETTCFRSYFGLSPDFEATITSEACANQDSLLTCKEVSAFGLCDTRMPGKDMFFQEVCPVSCGCCEISHQCWCDNNYIAHRISRKFGMDLNCQQAKEKYGCHHHWVGPLLTQYCPCSCPTEHPTPDPTPEPTWTPKPTWTPEPTWTPPPPPATKVEAEAQDISDRLKAGDYARSTRLQHLMIPPYVPDN